jgi:acetyl-CoA carboxylase biotin carboxyl carrier protein
MSSGPKTDETQLQDIEALIADFQASGMRELHVRAGDVEIYLSTDASAPGLGAQAVAVRVEPMAPSPTAPGPTATPVATPSAPAAAQASALPEGAVIVTAPYLGTFYRAPKPGSPVYVDVGSTVTEETEMCLVEVMKLFTAVRAGVSGTVHAILATDGAMVEADQPLFAVMPA